LHILNKHAVGIHSIVKDLVLQSHTSNIKPSYRHWSFLDSLFHWACGFY